MQELVVVVFVDVVPELLDRRNSRPFEVGIKCGHVTPDPALPVSSSGWSRCKFLVG